VKLTVSGGVRYRLDMGQSDLDRWSPAARWLGAGVGMEAPLDDHLAVGGLQALECCSLIIS
jgi:hypothetical protein